MGNHKRSIVKSISWRIIATAVIIVMAYIWFGEWVSSISLGIVANGLKAVLYYLHERGWNLVGWGWVFSTTSIKEGEMD